MTPPPSHDTFAARLDMLVQADPDRVMLIDDDRPLTAMALRDTARRLAGGMAQHGVKVGDRVAVWLPNSAEWVSAFLACAHLGALVLAVNTRFRSREVADLLGRGRADWLVYWPGFKGIAFDAILEEIPAQTMQRLRGIFLAGSDAVFGLRALAQATPADVAALVPAENAGVICFTTSGTTSLPKFVLHDQRTLLRHGDAVAHAYGYDRDTRILATAPYCGVFGFAALLGGLAAGVPVVSEPVFDPQRAARAVARHRITHAYLNNEALHRMLDAEPTLDYSSVRLFGFATFAPSLEHLPEQAARRGIPLVGLYGSSELIALVAAQPSETPAEDSSGATRYLPGGRIIYPDGRVRARDPANGRILPAGESGEIEILSPSLMCAYLDDPQASAQAVTQDGYFKTGDLGYTVNERHFVFQTRLGDSLRLSGFLVNPAEIEQFVAGLPAVKACQVVGVERDGKTLPFAFVLLRDGQPADPAHWLAACRRELAGYKVPAGFHVLDAFPSVESANSVKIQKHRLRDMARDILIFHSTPS